MKHAVYINGMGCVSPQHTTSQHFLEEVILSEANKLQAVNPNYKDFIKGSLIRRMGKGVKMGIVASSLALSEAGIELPEAIITGTGEGCLRDSEKFLEAILDNNEQLLTPTPFIQSTHNTVGAQIALGLQCNSYNITFTNGANSFEAALIDALLHFAEGKNNVLVGGVDEIGEKTFKFNKCVGRIKGNNMLTPGTSWGEGASFFALSNSRATSSYAEINAVTTFYKIDDIKAKLIKFLKNQDVELNEIDTAILGINDDDDEYSYYANMMEVLGENTQLVKYKHLSGEFNTASAFGLWLGAKILKNQYIPEVVTINKTNKEQYKRILLYNQYEGENHSLILISAC